MRFVFIDTSVYVNAIYSVGIFLVCLVYSGEF